MYYREIKQDLFQTDTEFALAQCISKDCALGAGIAKEFRRRYPMMPKTIAANNPSIGDAIAYETEEWTIFNLITKEKYWNKPTYETFEGSIRNLKRELLERHISKKAIPQIGAGLDRLDWDRNRRIIHRVFADTNITMDVCLWK